MDSAETYQTSPSPFEVSDQAVEVIVEGVTTPLSYSVPSSLSGAGIGDEVTVQLGRRTVRGWVIGTMSLTEALRPLHKQRQLDPQLALFSGDGPALKPITSAAPSFEPRQLDVFRWIADYYGDSLYDVIDNAVPHRVASREDPAFELAEAAPRLFSDPDALKALERRSPVQFRVMSTFEQQPVVQLSALASLAPSARKAVTILEERGLIRRLLHRAQSDRTERPVSPALTGRQDHAVTSLSRALDAGGFYPALLFGVTGSGKTEVYIRLIEAALALGGSALVVVPEIALTPQLFDLFERRLSVAPALLHSQVVPSARWRSWAEMLSGETRVAIGARSAVFAPLQNLKLIIVDEEHESSYKQSDGVRYHGRDVAVMRGKLEGCTVVLGSATPSFETLLNAQRKRYHVLELPERATARPLPTLEIVDLNLLRRSEMPSENISPRLHALIGETLGAGGQVVILYNRRGFSSYLQCTTCNEVLLCRHCSVPLTVHKGAQRMLCHYCNESIPPPTHCAFCRDPRTSRIETIPEAESEDAESIGLLEPRGAGTERVVEELAALFPEANIVRLDRDTTTHRDAYREILGKMRSGEAQILVGTQMIAKGHDLPGVTLVGIVDADVGLHAPDFRSSERTFQLITQAAGRAGRGQEPGRVIVQTREPNHPTIVATTTGRFTAFARYELEYRKKLRYPPWGKLMRVVVSSPDAQDALRGAELTRTAVDELIQAASAEGEASTNSASASFLSVLGPAPAPHERLRGRYRWHLVIKADSAKVLSRIAAQLHHWKKTVKGIEDFRLVVDVDPVDML